jgi:hypothetical protein
MLIEDKKIKYLTFVFQKIYGKNILINNIYNIQNCRIIIHHSFLGLWDANVFIILPNKLINSFYIAIIKAELLNSIDVVLNTYYYL